LNALLLACGFFFYSPDWASVGAAQGIRYSGVPVDQVIRGSRVRIFREAAVQQFRINPLVEVVVEIEIPGRLLHVERDVVRHDWLLKRGEAEGGMRGSWFAKGGSAADGVIGDCGVLVEIPVSEVAGSMRKSVRRKGVGCRSALTSKSALDVGFTSVRSVTARCHFAGRLWNLEHFWPNPSGVKLRWQVEERFECQLASGSQKRHTCLDRELTVTFVIPHIYTYSNDTLSHITNVLKQTLHFKAVVEPLASTYSSRVCTKVKKSTEMNKREAKTKKAIERVVLKTTGVNCWGPRAAREPQPFGIHH
jgi:hypothetical protein